jgi:hypothetical protein
MGGWRARQLVEPAQHKLRLASFRRSPSGRCGRRICSYCWAGLSGKLADAGAQAR